MSTMTIDRPVRFSGSDEQAAANRLTHSFDYSDGDTRCMFCDCRPSHAAASYPCGEQPPREIVEIER